MSVGTKMRMVGMSAKDRAESVAHEMKDRASERRLDRAQAESERLRNENDLLRDEVSETRSEHRRILDLLEERFAELSDEVETADGKKKSHKGRWFLFLLAAGGAAYYWFTQRNGVTDEWGVQTSGGPSVTESSTTTAL